MAFGFIYSLLVCNFYLFYISHYFWHCDRIEGHFIDQQKHIYYHIQSVRSFWLSKINILIYGCFFCAIPTACVHNSYFISGREKKIATNWNPNAAIQRFGESITSVFRVSFYRKIETLMFWTSFHSCFIIFFVQDILFENINIVVIAAISFTVTIAKSNKNKFIGDMRWNINSFFLWM